MEDEASSQKRPIFLSPIRLLKLVLKWVEEQLSRTIFASIKFIVPKRFLNPFAFLGMLTFFTFAVLSATGLFLMFYYEPSLEGAYDSVYKITNEIPYGFVIRNIHYHASNLMILLAVMHCFYLFFKGRYKLRNKIMWLTGLVLGLLAVMEAFTGYSCIMNERAMFAMSISQTLASDVNPVLALIGMGSGSISEFILRFYTFHVAVIPAIMVLLMVVHFPRNLILDIPFMSTVMGVTLVVAGLFPAELGNKYFPGLSFAITVPEWYFAGIYALLRTGIDRDLAALILPAAFVGLLALIPFLDKGKSFRAREKPFLTAFGVAVICQLLLLTVWGSRSHNFIDPVTSDVDIPIDILVLGPVSALSSAVPFIITYLSFRKKTLSKATKKKRNNKFYILEDEAIALVAFLIIVQVALAFYGLQAYSLGYWETALIGWGVSFMAFGLTIFSFRVNKPKAVSIPRGRQESIIFSFRKAVGILLGFQALIIAYIWSLDPFFYKTQKIFGVLASTILIVFALIVQLYRVNRKMTKRDYEWLAVGIAVLAQLILFIFFL